MKNEELDIYYYINGEWEFSGTVILKKDQKECKG